MRAEGEVVGLFESVGERVDVKFRGRKGDCLGKTSTASGFDCCTIMRMGLMDERAY